MAALVGMSLLFRSSRRQTIPIGQTTVGQTSPGLTASTPFASQRQPSPSARLTPTPQTITAIPTGTQPLWRKELLQPYGSPPAPPTITPIPTVPPPTLIATPTPAIVLETDALRLELTSNGRTQGIVDKVTGVNHVADPGPYRFLYPFVLAVHENQSLYPGTMRLEGDNLIVRLGCYTPSITVTLGVERFDRFLTFEVVNVQGPLPRDVLRFAQLVPDLAKAQTVDAGISVVSSADFALCIVALNDQVEIYPGASMVAADVRQPSEIEGVKVAIFGAPPSEVADIINEILRKKTPPVSDG